MTTQNPATPAPAATPGNVPQDSNPTPVASPAPSNGASGNSQEGKVTISTKEFAQLQRDAARARSAAKRADLARGRNPIPVVSAAGDPDAAQAIAEANARAAESERIALQSQVRSGVRDLLEKDEFKGLPKSTKELILKNPALLSEADNLEEAMLDIEDFVRDQVLSLESAPAATPAAPQPAGVETPPAGGGGPAPTKPVGLEDTSKLTGTARSIAVLKNAVRKAQGVK